MDNREMKYKCYAFLYNGVNKEVNERIRKAGYANGYVAVPPQHPLYRVQLTHIDLPIHGGISLTEPAEELLSDYFNIDCVELLNGEIPNDYWVLGFDTLHPGDNLGTRPREWCIEEVNKLKTILENWK